MDIKVSNYKHISRWVIERISSVLDEMEWKTIHKDEEGDQ